MTDVQKAIIDFAYAWNKNRDDWICLRAAYIQLARLVHTLEVDTIKANLDTLEAIHTECLRKFNIANSLRKRGLPFLYGTMGISALVLVFGERFGMSHAGSLIVVVILAIALMLFCGILIISFISNQQEQEFANSQMPEKDAITDAVNTLLVEDAKLSEQQIQEILK